jgi:hypothetical protein
MDRLAETLSSSAKALPEGGLIFPKGFLRLASRAAVDQAFARLTREGKLLRVSRGVYTSPVSSRFGVRPPSTISVIESIESFSGEIVVPNGAAEANVLGLTTQVPIREVFLTSGRSRKLHLGNRVVELKHADHWQLMLGKRPAGMAIRALSWLEPGQAPAALGILRTKLPPSEWIAMRSARATLPSWMARAVSGATL